MRIDSLLILCRGNICRSPMAQACFAYHLKNFNPSLEILSAGIDALVGHPPDKNALKIMQQRNIDISKHRARQVDDKLIRKADLILVMTNAQLKKVTNKFILAKGKTYLLGHWQHGEIEDPFMQPCEIFENTYQKIELALQDWKTRIFGCQTAYA